MKRISTRLLLSAALLAGSLSTASAQTASGRGLFSFGRTPQTAAASRPGPMPSSTINDNSIELAGMEARTITVPAGPSASAPGQAAPSVQLVNCRSLVIDFELKGLGPSGVGGVELWYTRNGQT